MIIGLTGQARSGKDTIGNYLANQHGAICTSFAAPIRMFVSELCGYSSLSKLEAHKDEAHPLFQVSPRYMMQTLGTEWGRNLVDPELWTKIVRRRIEVFKQQNQFEKVPGILAITDIRFENEAELIREQGGTIWHIRRPDATLAAASNHSSEAGVAVFPMDTVIANESTRGALYNCVEIALQAYHQQSRE